MNEKMKRKTGETLHRWIERIAPMCVGKDEKDMAEVLHAVSVESYIKGTELMNPKTRRTRNEMLTM